MVDKKWMIGFTVWWDGGRKTFNDHLEIVTVTRCVCVDGNV